MPVTHQLPAGPMNLESLFPTVDFDDVVEYNLQLEGPEGTVLTTPNYTRSCCCDEDVVVRLFFVNYLSGVDAINMKINLEETETDSETWKKTNAWPHEKWDGGMQRYSVNSNEVVTVENTCFAEEDQEWLKELVGAPNAWVQWFGTQGQSNDYIPVVILDGKFITRKLQERYYYTLQLQFRYSNENVVIRN